MRTALTLAVATVVVASAGCGDDGPVADQPAPSPVGATATTVVPIAAEPVSSPEWTPVSSDDAVFGPGRVNSIIAAPEAFVAVGQSCRRPTRKQYPTCRATIWRSPDGVEWSRAFVDPIGRPGASPSGTWFHDIAVNDLGYVAVGSTYHVWVSYPVFGVSADGETWVRRQPLKSIWLDTDAPLSVVATDDAFLAAGQSCEMGGDCRGVIWRSEDGIHWATVLEDVWHSGFADIAQVADGYLAVGGTGVGLDLSPNRDESARIWSSPDGITWTDISSGSTVSGSDGPGQQAREFALVLTEVGGGGVVAGSALEEHRGAIWLSEDGASWNRLPIDDVFDNANITGLAASGDVLIAVGALSDEPELTVPRYVEPGHAVAWRSDDGGLTWERMDIDPALTGDDSRFLDVTIHGDTALAGLSVDGRAAIWTLDLDRADREVRAVDMETSAPEREWSDTLLATEERVYDPALSGWERAALVSEWAEERNLLTVADVVATLGESTTRVVDAESPIHSMDPFWAGFTSPFPETEFVMDSGIDYVLEREGHSRIVTMYVSEFVSRGPAIAEMFADMAEGEGRRNTADERYDPAPIGVDAFAYETDGGSGALDRVVVVNTGDALVVIAATPTSPAVSAALTESENLTREQVDDLVRAAVEKLG